MAALTQTHAQSETASDPLQAFMRFAGQLGADRVSGTNFAPGDDNPHDAGLDHDDPILSALRECCQEPGTKGLDLPAGVAQACDFDDRSLAYMQPRASGKGKKSETACSDVLSDVAGREIESRLAQLVMKFGMNQVHLAQIGSCRVFFHAHAMLHRRSEMGITFDTQAGNELDCSNIRLREIVTLVAAHGRNHPRQLPVQPEPAHRCH